jgi:flagellar motility protein MotE (MotC chaperone)
MTKKKTAKPRRMRLLPLTVTMLSLLFVVKVNELYLGSKQLREIYGARDAQAEEKKAEQKPAEHAAADKAPEADKAKIEEKPVEAVKEEAKADGHGEAKKEGDAAHGEPAKEEAKAEGHGEEKPAEGGHGEAKDDGHGGGAKPPEEPRTHGTGKSTVKDIEAMKAKDAQPLYTKTELDLLQNLVKRRDELDQREKDFSLKSKVLEATEKRINDKITEMKTLEGELSKVLALYNEKQDAQLKSLVKIYESMKPEEAAAIFNEMEMPILLEVIAKMSERKVAPVLANMSPKKAKDVTQELAEKRKKVSAATGTSTPAATTKP